LIIVIRKAAKIAIGIVPVLILIFIAAVSVQAEPTPTPSPSPSPTPTPTPTPPPAKKSSVSCQWHQDSDVKDFVENLDPAVRDEVKKLRSGDRKAELFLFRLTCKLHAGSDVNELTVKAEVNYPSCQTESDKICLVHAEAPAIEIGKNKRKLTASALFTNPNYRQKQVLKSIQIPINVSPMVAADSEVESTDVAGMDAGITMGGYVKQSECQIFVTGSSQDYATSATCSGPDCNPAGQVDLENGTLIFKAIIKGAAGPLMEPKTVQWSGGPDKSGTWADAPIDQNLMVRAQATSADGEINHCAIRIRQLGKGYYLKLKKYGDCPYYRSLRDYFYLNAKDNGPQIGGYPQPLTLPGFDVEYGAKGPDIPFRGALNVATDLQGNLTTANGALVLPSINNRKFSQAVVVAYTMDPTSKKIGKPAYYGLLNPENYENTQMRPLSAQEPEDSTLLVYQFFLAAKEMVSAVDSRGSTGTPFYQFKESRSGLPHDYLVPVVNESCMPVFQIQTPKRSDKAQTPDLKDAVTCAFSRPFKVGDLKRGRVNLSVMHFVSEAAHHLFPTDLLSGSIEGLASSSTSANQETGPKQCWKLFPSFNVGNPTWTIDLQTGKGTGQAANFLPPPSAQEGEKDGVTSAAPTHLRQKNPGDECSLKNGAMGFRYSGEAIRWGFGFGVQVKQSGVGTVNIWNQPGINSVARHLAGSPTTAILTTAPSYQIRNQTIAARHWGHATLDLLNPNEGGEGGHATLPGGNVISSVTAPICPGSQFKYDNVSTSWSPLILDIKGKGIVISRSFQKSVAFDIKGDGLLRYVDWPVNTNEVAFLVLPDEKSEVRSIRELFGDDRHRNGFEKLKSHVLAGETEMSAKSPAFDRLKLWFDRNRNGIAESAELEPLARYAKSIELAYRKPAAGTSAIESTLNGIYKDAKTGQLKNIEDHYFNEYVDRERYRFESNFSK